MATRDRIDKILVDRGLAGSRERAAALIMEGKVLVDGHPVTKAGEAVSPDASVELRGEDIPYVSRGGLKLAAALDHCGFSPAGKIAMDVGASTGGFTDVMLQRGAVRVYCIDVGYGQLAWKLQQDERVVLMDRTNIRHLDRSAIPGPVDIATVDVSFISLSLVIPKVIEFLRPGGEIVALVKPQFEVGKGSVGKGGIVKDEAKRKEAVEKVRRLFESLGLRIVDIIESPILGQKGNTEYLICAVLA